MRLRYFADGSRLKGHSFSCAVERGGTMGCSPRGTAVLVEISQCWAGLKTAAGLCIASLLVTLTMSASPNSAPASGKSTSQTPDIIFLNGDIYTQAIPRAHRRWRCATGASSPSARIDDIRKLKGAAHAGRRSRRPFRHARLQRRPRAPGGGRPRAAEVDLRGVSSLAGDAAAHRRQCQDRSSRRLARGRRLGPHPLDQTASCRRARTLTRSPAIIPRYSFAWTATSPSPTRRP